ncbi:hypothetical protein ACLB1T_33620 [Escherichia coli]
MGLTPLEGLVMGTRSGGDTDRAIIFHLHDTLGMSVDAINKLLTKVVSPAGSDRSDQRLPLC